MPKRLTPFTKEHVVTELDYQIRFIEHYIERVTDKNEKFRMEQIRQRTFRLIASIIKMKEV